MELKNKMKRGKVYIIFILLITLILAICITAYHKNRNNTSKHNNILPKDNQIVAYVDENINVDNEMPQDVVEEQQTDNVEQNIENQNTNEDNQIENNNQAEENPKVETNINNKNTQQNTTISNKTQTSNNNSTTPVQETPKENNNTTGNNNTANNQKEPEKVVKEEPKEPQEIGEKYVRNDEMIEKIRKTIENNTSEYMINYGYEIVVDSSIKTSTNQFTFTETRVKNYIVNRFGTIKIYAEDYYRDGQYIMTQCYIL
ncbi:MAG: hypothetical protein HFJ49_01355 [Clostridia bacterium]|nr:hypothetical protein [Clostridia bacterium]